jgi:hypothetical protein
MHESRTPPAPAPAEPESEEQFPFTPVPTGRNRHDGWTPERQRAFIDALARTGIVNTAVRFVGKSPASAYKLRQRPDAESFAAAWDDALAEARLRAFDAIVSRAVRGSQIPRFYAGNFAGMRHCFETRIALAALRYSDALPPAGARGRGKGE